MQFLPCFLCGAKLDKRLSKKKNKPYFVCNTCGIQLFVRRDHGIQLLDKLLRASDKNELPFKQRSEELAKIQALLTEINGTKAQIERMEAQTALFFPDSDKVRACNLLKLKLHNLFAELEQIAELKRAI
jgi:DNA-directed RNA polymerase subunit RPC12/RpoP